MKIQTVHVLGLGGTGSILIETLCRLLMYHDNGTASIHIWDGDVYEDRNGKRQLFDRSYIGVNKALATAHRYKKTFPNLIAHNEFANEQSLVTTISNSAIFPLQSAMIVTTVDNDASRSAAILAAEHLTTKSITLVIPGNGEHTGSCFLFARYRAGNRLLWKPGHPFELVPQWKLAEEAARPGSCAYEAVSAPQTLNANMASAYLSLNAIEAVLSGRPYPYRMSFDTMSNTLGPVGCTPERIVPN